MVVNAKIETPLRSWDEDVEDVRAKVATAIREAARSHGTGAAGVEAIASAIKAALPPPEPLTIEVSFDPPTAEQIARRELPCVVAVVVGP